MLTEPVPELLAGDRLDAATRRHRRPHVPPLLPHDARRPRADGQRLRARRARWPCRPRLARRRAAQSRAHDGLRRAPPRRSPTHASRRAGAARSTSRPTSCRASGRSPARGSTSAPATRATASGRAGSAARSSPRSRSARATSGRRFRSSTGAHAGCRPSRSATSAAGLVALGDARLGGCDRRGATAPSRRPRRRSDPAAPTDADRRPLGGLAE